MEQNTSLFSLSIDPITKAHLSETAKWARFLAIVGFVFLLLVIMVGIYSTVTISRFEESYREMGGGGLASAAGASMAVTYIIMAVIWFFPLFFTFRFSSQMRTALQGNDQELLNAAFHNLKVCYRYLGIVTVIFLVLIALSLLFGIMGLALS